VGEGENSSGRGKRRILAAIAVLLLLGLSAAGYWYFHLRGYVYSNDARFDGDLVDMAPQIGGTITAISVREGDHVASEQVLFALDNAALDASVARAEAAVNSARAGLAAAQAQYRKGVNGPLASEIAAAQASERRLQAEVSLAEADWKRSKALFDQRVVTEAAQDKARTALETAKRAHEEVLNHLELLKEGTREEDLAVDKANSDLAAARVCEAEGALRQARVNLGYAEVHSPFDGFVVRRWRNPGATVSAGTPVLTVLNPATLYVAANIEEKYLDEIAVGEEVDVSVDAYPSLAITGRVEKILRATNSQFSLIPAEGVSGSYIKVTQRVPIRVAVQAPADVPLGPGLSVEIRIHTRRDAIR